MHLIKFSQFSEEGLEPIPANHTGDGVVHFSGLVTVKGLGD